MSINTQTGRSGEMEILNNKIEISAQSEEKSLQILINQCWKTLPIFEGKNKENQIVYSREEAYENYKKHLNFLITKISGASKIWCDNQYYLELLCMLVGMQEYTNEEHAKVKYMVHHCTKLINDMIDGVKNGRA